MTGLIGWDDLGTRGTLNCALTVAPSDKVEPGPLNFERREALTLARLDSIDYTFAKCARQLQFA